MSITFASSSNVITGSGDDSRVFLEPEYLVVLIDGTPYSFATASIGLLSTGHKVSAVGGSGSAIFTKSGKTYTYYT